MTQPPGPSTPPGPSGHLIVASEVRRNRQRGPKHWWVVFRSWPRSARLASYVATALVLLLLAVLLAGVVVVRRPLPEHSGELEVPGLTGTVEVLRDENGIPQLYADSLDDLLMAQGFVHAQERFFEMDIRRHVTAGRLSELFGEETLETDRVIRTMGWRRVAEREWAVIEPRTRQALEAYADGVNAYLESRGPSRLAVEYSLLRVGGLDYVPEPWTPIDSLAWLKAMAWDLRGNMDDEIGRVLAAVDHTRGRGRAALPGVPLRRPPPDRRLGRRRRRRLRPGRDRRHPQPGATAAVVRSRHRGVRAGAGGPRRRPGAGRPR